MKLAQSGLGHNRIITSLWAVGGFLALFLAPHATAEFRAFARNSVSHFESADESTLPSTQPLRQSQQDNAAGHKKQSVLVKDVLIRPGTESTRVTIVVDGSPRYLIGSLSNPERVYFDIPNARLEGSLLNRVFTVEDKFLKKARVGLNTITVVRVVLDLAGAGEVVVSDQADAVGITVDLHFKGSKPADAPVASKTAPGGPEIVAAPAKSALSAPAKATPKEQTPPLAGAKVPESVPPAAKADPAAKAKSQIAEPAAKASSEPKPVAPAAAKETKEAKENPNTELGAAKESPAQPPPPAREAVKSVLPATASEPLPKAAQPTSHGDRTLTRMLGLKIGRIVLDPGHGGQDKGTIGPGGLMEKDLVLAIARDLQKLLQEKLGANVVLTRSDDTFVSLEERTAIANQHQADLFVSIHANSSVIRSVSGVETYFLDFARSDSAREVAARENATSDRNVRDLQELVQKITQADKLQESRELATIMQKSLYNGVHAFIPSSSNRGVRSAPFIVLIGAHMPSVLAEVSFISNPRDEKLLLQDSNRLALAQSLFQGIEGYMKSLGSAAARNHQ